MSRSFSAIFLVLILLLTSLSLVVLSINKGDLNTALPNEENPMEVIVPLAQANIAGFQEGSIYTNTTLSAGSLHTCAILDNGDLKCWGYDGYGQLGDGGSNTDINAPSSTAIDLGTGRTAVAVAAGEYHTCAILDNGDLKCWGYDGYGQLGDDGSNTDINAPSSTAIDLGTGRTAVAVAAGGSHTCAILDNGDLKCWGGDYHGQLGDGGSNTATNAPSSTAIDLGTGRTAVAMSVGYYHTCAILDNGDLKCWGRDTSGQLGNGGGNTDTNAPSSTAIDLGTGRTAVAVDAGWQHTCAILNNGDLNCWGENDHGQLGDGGSNTDTNAPSSIAIDLGTGPTAVAVSAGNQHTCAILDNDDLKCWGYDYFGQLGDGGSNTDTNAPSSTAIDLGTGRTAVAMSDGYFHTCAILENSDVKCWGYDNHGLLGDGGSNNNTNAPSSTAIDLGTGRTVAVSERDLDDDGVLNIFDSTPYTPNFNIDPSNWTLSPNQGPHTGGTEVTMTGNFSAFYEDYQSSTSTQGSVNHTWSDSIISDNDGEAFRDFSIEIDSNDRIHAVFISNSQLKYITKGQNSWSSPYILENFTSSNYGRNSIAVDSNGNPHVAYWDGTYLKYMSSNNGIWNTPSVFSSATSSNAHQNMVIDANDHVHILYYESSTSSLALRTHDGVSWSNSTIDSSTYAYSYGASLYVDSNSEAYVAYFRNYGSNDRELLHSHFNGSSWTNSTVDTSVIRSCQTSIVVDSSSTVHVLYLQETEDDVTTLKLVHAQYSGGTWSSIIVDSDQAGSGTSLTMDSDDNLYLFYTAEMAAYEVRFASYDGTNWDRTMFSLNESIQSKVEMLIDSNRNLHVVYNSMENNAGNLEYLFGLSNYTPSESLSGSANVERTSWSNTTIGFEMSMVSSILDEDGHAHLSYYDILNTNLVYATNKNGSWVNYIIDSEVSGYGLSSSIAIDSNGTVHISYIDGDALFYVNLEISGTISSFGIDFGTAPTMRLPKLQVDSLNMPHIVYYDEANYELRYVTRANFATQWTDVLVHATEVHELEFQLDSSDTAQIVYTWGDDILVNHAKKAVGNWTLSGLPFGMHVEHLAFALGPNDDQHVIFRHDDTYDSRHLYNWNNSTWTSFGLTSEQDDAKYFDIQIDSLNRTHITYDGSDSSSSNAVGNVYQVIDPLNISNSYAVLGNNCRLLELDADDNIHCFFLNASGWQHSINLIGTSNQLQIEVGDYGNVTGLVVSDSILTFTTPVGPNLEEVVDITVWSKDGIGYVMNTAFTYLPSVLDSDTDGILDENDDCPNDAGNSTTDKVGCPDLDGDGYSDSGDLFPSNPSEWYDTDGDGAGDNGDVFPNDGNETSDSDGDGVGDNSDSFPNDGNETSDSDGDGVGDNADVFPNNSNETTDSDSDGVGDNADVFPNNSNETADSDNDGLGDNEDEYPFINNFIDSDGDEIPDLFDDFINDSTQWSDYDGDGYGDYSEGNNSDAFINNASQWFDTDGDGYGDNWGNSTWNQTRLFIWPGQFVENAVLADHCPTEFGNSTADGYFGCIDKDGDGIADIYDDLIQDESEMENQSNATNETGPVDSDGDGVEDLFDLCPSTMTGGYVDIDGCILDEDGDGVDDLKDACPGTKPDVSVNINGCIVGNDEPQSFIESLSSGDRGAVLQTVGIGAVLIAVLGFLQTNMVAALLPDSVRWIRVFRAGTKLNKEEIRELEYLKSLVQTYYQDSEMLHDELYQLKSELTARYTNSEIKKVTREKLNTLIMDLLAMEMEEMSRIAHNDAFFGLGGTLSTEKRTEYLSQDALMRFDGQEQVSLEAVATAQSDNNHPSKERKGEINGTDGHEYLEHPPGSESWYYRNHSTGEWEKWKN